MTIKHNEMVATLAKPGDAIIASLTAPKAHLLHMTIGIVGEVAELVDGIQSSKGRENVVEELGDLEFYLEGARQGTGLDRETTLHHDDSIVELLETYFNDPLTGLSIMAGNLLDVVKKHVIYNKPLDMAEFTKYLFVMETYLCEIRADEGVTYEETLEANIAKLRVRYEGLTYSDTAAQARADKVPA